MQGRACPSCTHIHFTIETASSSAHWHPINTVIEWVENSCEMRWGVRSGAGEMATHYSIPVWKISWTEEPAGYTAWGLTESDTTEHRHTHTHTHTHTSNSSLYLVLYFVKQFHKSYTIPTIKPPTWTERLLMSLFYRWENCLSLSN